jgi:3-hydroxyisobutyrate dehydrogenase
MPDVGGTLMLALAPGRLGEYLGTTGTRMGADDAIYAGFADGFIPQDQWPRVIAALEQSGDVAAVTEAICPPPPGQLRGLRAQIDQHFAGETLTDVRNSLTGDHSAFASAALGAMDRGSPLAMAATIEALHRLRGPSLSMTKALELEYRFSWRAMEHGDFLEGIRAAIIDKDRSPKWQFAGQDVPTAAVARMLAPLGRDALSLEDKK